MLLEAVQDPKKLPILLALPAIASGEAHTDMRLTVKPVLCIIDQRTPQCEMSFVVIWQTSSSGYYCLFSDFNSLPMRCWSEQRNGRLQDERTVRNDFAYWMASDDGEDRLAQVKVEVLRLDSDDRRRKRRTRHVWDIN